MQVTATLLGGCEFFGDKGERLEFSTRKSRALLAYLAVAPGVRRSRDQLAGLLWSRSFEEQARGSLRQTLLRARHVLGPAADALSSDADAVWLETANVATDLRRFESAAGQGSHAALTEAAHLYRGNFLAGFSINEPPFEDWVSGERRRIGETAIGALSRLLELLQAEGAVDQSITVANRLLVIDPLLEPVHRSLMRALVQQGRIESAIRQYRACRDVLKTELDVAPSEETEALYREIAATRKRASGGERLTKARRTEHPAVLSAGLYGFGTLMGDNRRQRDTPVGTLQNAIRDAGGEVIATPGSTTVARFNTVVDCVRCAAAVQREMAQWNADLPVDGRQLLRMGVATEGDARRPAAARAARLSVLAEPGGLCLDNTSFRASRDALDLEAQPVEDSTDSAELTPAYRVSSFAGHPFPDAVRSGPPQLRNLDMPLPDRPSIVILPFQDLAGTADRSHIAEGLRIDIQNALVKISGLFLIAAGSANAFRNADPVEAGQRLGVANVLHGAVRLSGRKIRLDVQLIDVASRQILWADRFDRMLDDSFAVQDDIARDVVAALDVRLVGGEQARVWRKTLRDVEALDRFYRGIEDFFRMEKAAMTRARKLFESVDRLQPSVPIGATWVAFAHWFDAFRRWSGDPRRSFALAGEWAGKAIAMEDADGQAHTVMGHVHLLDRKYDEALAVAREAVVIRPNCTNANGFYANVLHFCGDQAGAIEHIKRAMRFSPVYPPFFAGILATAYRADGQRAAAIVVAQEVLRLNPGDIQARLVLAACYVVDGWEAGARAVADEIRQIDPGFSLSRFAEAQPYRHPALMETWVAELRDAGLPE